MRRLETGRTRFGKALLALVLGTFLHPSLAQAQNVFVGDNHGYASYIYEYSPSGARTLFSSSVVDTLCLAFDSGGNLFVTTQGANIYKLSRTGVKTTFATGLYAAFGLAFDNSGNLYVADEYAYKIYKFAPDGTRTTFATGTDFFYGLAVDASGNVFVGSIDNVVYKYTPSGTRSTFASGVGYVCGLAFDSAGYLYVGDRGSDNIYKYAPNGARTTFATIPNTCGLAFDLAGNLFATDGSYGDVYKITPTGTVSLIDSGYYGSFGVAVQPPPVITYTWDNGGADYLWATPANWDVGGNPATPPTAYDLASFAGAALGTVTVSGSAAVGSIQFSAAGYTLAGGTLALGSTAPQVRQTAAVTGTNTISSAITSGAAISFDIQAGTLALNNTVNAGAAVNLSKSGAGTLSIGAAQTYTGATTLYGGTVKAGVADAIPAASILTINSGARLDLNGHDLSRANNATPANGNVILNSGTISGTGSTLYAGTVSGNTVSIKATGTSAVTTTTINLANAGTGGERWFIAANDGDVLTITSNITGAMYDTHFGGNGTIILTGSGTWTDTRSQSLAAVGQGTYNPAGAAGTTRLVVENNYAISTTKTFYICSPGSLVMRDISGSGISFANALNIAGTGYNNLGAIQNWAGINGGINNNTLSGTITLNGASNIGADTGTQLTIRGQINGAYALTKVGGGALVLANPANTNNYGALVVSEGRLQLGAADQIPDGSAVTVASGAILDRAGFNDTLGSPSLSGGTVSGAGTFTLGGPVGSTGGLITGGTTSLGGNTITFTVSSGTLTIADRITSGTLTKTGTGALVLSGSSGSDVTARVSGGALNVSGSIAGGTVIDGGTLQGAGCVGTITATSGHLHPGGSTGILHSASAAMSSGLAFDVTLDGPAAGTGYSQLDVTGTVDLGGATLNATLGYDAPRSGSTARDLLFIIRNDGTDAISGQFAGLPQNSTFDLLYNGTAYTATISYLGDYDAGTLTGGNDVVLMLPEPATLALLALGGLAALARRRRAAKRYV